MRDSSERKDFQDRRSTEPFEFAGMKLEFDNERSGRFGCWGVRWPEGYKPRADHDQWMLQMTEDEWKQRFPGIEFPEHPREILLQLTQEEFEWWCSQVDTFGYDSNPYVLVIDYLVSECRRHAFNEKLGRDLDRQRVEASTQAGQVAGHPVVVIEN